MIPVYHNSLFPPPSLRYPNASTALLKRLLDGRSLASKIALALPANERKALSWGVEPRQKLHVVMADATTQPRRVGRLVNELTGRQRIELRREQQGVIPRDAKDQQSA